MSDILIETASRDDAKLIAALGLVTFYEAYFEQDEPGDMANYLFETYSPERIAAEIEDPLSTYLIMFRDRRAVGFAKLQRDSREDGVEGVMTIQLKRIYLVERAWGTGLGAELLNHCVGIATDEGCDSIWLDVWERNERGQRFYAKHGFKQVGTMEFPYGDTVGINLVMERMI